MKQRITMRAALADPRLLGNALCGVSWENWRIILIAAMGESLRPEEREVFQRFTGRLHEPGARIEEALFLIGRRGGKDRAAAVLATYFAALLDWSPVLAKGERGLVLCIGADQRQAKITRDYTEGCIDASPMLSALVTNRTADTIELSNGISIEVRASSFRRLRGVTCVAVIATEAAFWLTEESSNPDTEILNSVRPSLATTGGPLIIITTPYARRGEVWNLYRRHFGADGDALVLVAQGTSRDFNPTLSQRVVDRALERDAAAAGAEYLAQFRTDIESFVAREAVEGAVVAGRYELPPVDDFSYVAFVDPSGGSLDAMTLSISHRAKDGCCILDAVRECRPPFSPESVVAEFAKLLKTYGIRKINGDRYAGEWPRERFQVHGIAYQVAEKPKSDIYRDLLPLLNSGRVELLDHSRLTAQLCGLERRTSRGGKDSIDHAPGSHDDVANSVAGSLLLALASAPTMWRQEALLIDGAAVPMPTSCDLIFATVVAGQRAEVAIIYWAFNRAFGYPLVLLDLDLVPLAPELLKSIASRLVELSKCCRARARAVGLYASKSLAEEAHRQGYAAEIIDGLMIESELLMLSAATHISAGRVKITANALAKAEQHPGDIIDATAAADEELDAVRAAVLIGIALALDEGRSLTRAA